MSDGGTWVTLVQAEGGISRQCTCCGAIAVEFINIRLQLDSSELGSFLATARSIDERERRRLPSPATDEVRDIQLVIAPGRLTIRISRAEIRALRHLLEATWMHVLRNGPARWPSDQFN